MQTAPPTSEESDTECSESDSSYSGSSSTDASEDADFRKHEPKSESTNSESSDKVSSESEDSASDYSQSDHLFQQQVNNQLVTFSQSLKREESYLIWGIKLCERVKQLLLEKQLLTAPGCPLALRLKSFEYVCNVLSMNDLETSANFCIIVKVKNSSPPFSDVLTFICITLKDSASCVSITANAIVKSRTCVKFKFWNQMKVTIVPIAINIAIDKIAPSIRKRMRIPNLTLYNSGLVKRHIKFMEEQDDFCKTVCRLSKFWYDSMKSPAFNLQDSNIWFELLTVSAVFVHLNMSRYQSLVQAFMKLVEMVKDFDKVKVRFQRTRITKGAWKLMDLTWDEKEKKLPFILEPVDVSNNLLGGVTKDQVQILKRNGRIMLSRMKDLLDNSDFCTCDEKGALMDVNFKRLFRSVYHNQL